MKRRMLLLAAGGLAGCAPLAGLRSADVERPLLVQLPLAQAGVRDERAIIAALMARELQRLPPHLAVARDLALWLHGVQTSPALDPARLAQIDQRFAARRTSTSVLIVPGLFGDCVDDQSVPFGDGLVRPREREALDSYAAYADLGLQALRMVPLPGRAPSAQNGVELADALRAEGSRPGVSHLVVLGYSKGLADALHAIDHLQSQGGLPRSLQALVSVAGAVMGTPLADEFESLYAAWSPHINPGGCSASDGTELASLTRRERVRWLADHPLPAPLQRYSLIAWGQPDEMALPLRATHALLSRFDDRNDGQLLASDAILPGSSLLATVRSDHWDIALPRDRHPSALVRGIGSGRHYPREALLRATLTWVISQLP
jgi:hypothetical protein